MDRLEKYLKKLKKTKKDIYIQKILHYASTNSLHGGGELRVDTIGNINKYINDKLNTQGATSNKYFVVVYGPPASGKSVGKKIGAYLINKHFEESINNQVNINNVFDTFVDCGVDDLVEDYIPLGTEESIVKIKENDNKNQQLKKINDRTGNIMKNAFTEYLELSNNGEINQENINKVKNDIDTIVNSSYAHYSAIRTGKHRNNSHNLDALSELLIMFSCFLSKNIFFETASADIEYLFKMIDMVKYYKYIPIIIYPFIGVSNI